MVAAYLCFAALMFTCVNRFLSCCDWCGVWLLSCLLVSVFCLGKLFVVFLCSLLDDCCLIARLFNVALCLTRKCCFVDYAVFKFGICFVVGFLRALSWGLWFGMVVWFAVLIYE